MRCVIWFMLWAGALQSCFALPADFAWIQTARVFLLDAYEPPFVVNLEYDAEALADTMAKMNANTVRIATMGMYAMIQGVRFPLHPQLGKRDMLAETIAACKRRGIRVIPYISTGHRLAWTTVTGDRSEYAHHAKPGGGPKRSRMFVGPDYGTVCWNTSYRQAYLDLVEHVVRDYDIDGIYFDTWRTGYFWGKGPGAVCYCDGCRKGFRGATGMELPWREKEADYTTAELAVLNRYHSWLQDKLVETVRDVRKLVRSYKNVPLIYNVANPSWLAKEDPRVLEAMDAFLYERAHSILDRAEGVSLARASGLGVVPYVGEYNNWPRATYNGFDFQQQIFTTTMFGGAPILSQPWGYVQHAAFRRFAEYPFGVLKRHESSFAGFNNYPYVAVVYGNSNPPEFEQRGMWWKADARMSSQGAFAACLYGHVQVSSIHESLLDDPAKLREYRVLYLADITHLSDARVRNIKQFVRDGGGLVVSHASSLFDAAGNRQKRFALEELLKAAPVEPAGELAATLASYRTMTGGPYDLYLAERSQRSIDQLTPLWHYQPVKALEGGEVWKQIVTGDGFRPILPGVIVSQYGKGRVVYSVSALESLFLQVNNPVVQDLLLSLVAKVAPEPPPYEVKAPSALITNLTTKGDTVVLHMANWTGNKLERAGANEYYLAPVEDVHVRLVIPRGKRVRAVTLLVDAPYKKEQKGSTLDLSFPRVQAYQAVRVDFE